MWHRDFQVVWPWWHLISWIQWKCETLNITQGNEYEETHPPKNCMSFGLVLPYCPSKHLPMLPCFECGVCSLFQLQAWTDLEKQTKPNLQPNVLEAWTTQSGLSATVAHTCEDCTWSEKFSVGFCFGVLFVWFFEFVDEPGLHSRGECEASEKLTLTLGLFHVQRCAPIYS